MSYTDEENWDPNEWQGRSKKQVDSNNWVAATTFLLGIGILLVIFIISLFK